MNNLEFIPFGHEEPAKRPHNSCADRKLRDDIEYANKHGDCIINVGNGYYRPCPGDLTDEHEFNEYIAQGYHRIREQQTKLFNMQLTFRDWSENGVKKDNYKGVVI